MISLIPLLIVGAYVGWNIGANDAGNCIGTSVGSGLLSYRRAILLVSLFVVVGAVLQGGNVMKTIGKGIVVSELPTTAIVSALVSSGLFVTLATFFRIPVSTSQAIVGGVAGAGFASGAEINLATIGTIAQVWVICPFLTGLLAFLIYGSIRYVLRRVGPTSFWQNAPNALLVLSACYVAFALGANDVGNAMGPIANTGVAPTWLGLLGGLSLAAGALMFGHRVTETIGSGITRLDTMSAASAQLAAALAVHFFSILGIPVSTSQSIVGAVIGVGLIHGFRTVRATKILEIALGWVITPTAAGLFSFALVRILRRIG